MIWFSNNSVLEQIFRTTKVRKSRFDCVALLIEHFVMIYFRVLHSQLFDIHINSLCKAQINGNVYGRIQVVTSKLCSENIYFRGLQQSRLHFATVIFVLGQ